MARQSMEMKGRTRSFTTWLVANAKPDDFSKTFASGGEGTHAPRNSTTTRVPPVTTGFWESPHWTLYVAPLSNDVSSVFRESNATPEVEWGPWKYTATLPGGGPKASERPIKELTKSRPNNAGNRANTELLQTHYIPTIGRKDVYGQCLREGGCPCPQHLSFSGYGNFLTRTPCPW